MRISDWSSDVCSSDLLDDACRVASAEVPPLHVVDRAQDRHGLAECGFAAGGQGNAARRSFQQLRAQLFFKSLDLGCERSEERRVGKECFRPCRIRWLPEHKKQKRTRTTMKQIH